MNIEKKALAAWAKNERDRFESALQQFVEPIRRARPMSAAAPMKRRN